MDIKSGFESGQLRPPQSLSIFSLDDAVQAYQATADGKRSIIIPTKSDELSNEK